MDIVITAGGIPQPKDLLYTYTQGIPKALLKIADKPMLQWVLDAVGSAQSIERIVIVGPPEIQSLKTTKPIFFIPNTGEMFTNIRSGILKLLEIDPQPRQVAILSSDVPSITGEIIDWIINTANKTGAEICYYAITRQVMEKKFPNARRSYYWFKDVEVCGADIHVVHTRLITHRPDMWQRLLAVRKNAFKQAALIGYGTLFSFLFRLRTLADTGIAVSRRLDVQGQVILCPYAEAGMDVDKPFQYDILSQELTRSKA